MFHATGKGVEPVYHTNVLMSIGEKFAVVCLDAIAEREKVETKLKDLGKEILTISKDQMAKYAGNILEIGTTQHKLLMSTTAHDAFTTEQLEKLTGFAQPLVVNIDIIETIGGGSARCTFCEIFP